MKVRRRTIDHQWMIERMEKQSVDERARAMGLREGDEVKDPRSSVKLIEFQ